ncbi:MAG: tRNA 2-thiouridine(34) synthase MnmA [Rhodospirillales bacterium]|nr:tRNA 2-thiouridine(34) synthase MnmA [Rhodospirillales bacterium]MCB9996901.1 tRNA 2-thiouridine(34) synthase MnmA [Rhodospirillales bacterium]
MTQNVNSLGFAKAPAETRVVVAMSGGVDSSVTAALLHEQGYDVVGVTLQLYDHGQALAKKGACCAGQDIYDARRVAEERGFPHYVLDYESNFRDAVIEEFADSYLKGQTPIPCVRCNQTVKFRDLLKVAHDLGADCMATGHYIQRLVNNDGQAELHRAVDTGKDQSYFLFATTQEQLDFLRFPLGGWDKDITRQHAQRLGLLNADKPDSQDICFVPGGDYTKVVKKLRPEAEIPGEIMHIDGRVLGAHSGIINYTIGQRKGLGIGGGHDAENNPFYVVALEPAQNRVIVGPKEALARDVVYIKDCNWLGDHSGPVNVKLRSVSRPDTATLERREDGTALLRLNTAQYGIAPGQAAVCYDGGRVLGGGWIYATENSALQLAA